MPRVLTNRFPELSLATWFAVLAFGIWRHSHAATQLPLGDAFAYYVKANNAWSLWRSGLGYNAFDVWPFFRPPGTVLMSYPFGFNPDPRGFFFRSVFFPAILLGLAVLVATYAPGEAPARRWRSAGIAAFFSALPMLYMFEANPLNPAPEVWGMVDGFLTGCAAFTIACAWRGFCKRPPRQCWTWYLLTGLSAAFCITVKPAGIVVACLAALCWGVLGVLVLLLPPQDRRRRQARLRELIFGAICVIVPIASVLEAAFASRYLSAASVATGQANIAEMKAQMHISGREFLWLVHHDMGEPLLLWLALGLAAVALSCRRRFSLPPAAAAAGMLLLCGFGLWFWMVYSGGQLMIRYAMPFFMMGALLLAAGFHAVWEQSGARLRAAAMILMLAAPLNLALLLLAPSPALAWQRLSGVSVSPPPPCPVQPVLLALASQNRIGQATLYVLSIDYDYAVANSMAQLWSMQHPHRPALGLLMPVDWVHPATYRLADVIGSTYIMAPGPAAPRAPPWDLSSFGDETLAMTAWARSLTTAQGVDIVYDGPDARILRVVDRRRLEDSARQLVRGHAWRDVFKLANTAFLPSPTPWAGGTASGFTAAAPHRLGAPAHAKMSRT